MSVKNGFELNQLSILKEYLRFNIKPIREISISQNELNELKKEFANIDFQSLKIRLANNFSAVISHELESEVGIKSINSSKDLILALDHITDPRNFGAIIRSAAFFGVKTILVPLKRQVKLTQVVFETARGGLALTEVVGVVNLSRTLTKLKQSGYWIFGAQMSGLSYKKLVNNYEKIVLVLGNEEKGLSVNVMKKCDELVSIDGAAETLDSLNVSVSAGVLLSTLMPKL